MANDRQHSLDDLSPEMRRQLREYGADMVIAAYHGAWSECMSLLEEHKAALAAFVDDEPCRYDHHGGCQTHDPNEGMAECRMAVARRVLLLEDLSGK